jgi:PIN domain nuclease of toxin-antitoxin system
MKILLDTQILIWFQLDDPQLTNRVRTMIEDPNNRIFVSHLSFMEITIKQTVNRLPTFMIPMKELAKKVETDGFTSLPISFAHIITYHQIPLHDDHRDPFDRLILATALAEQMPIISADDKFKRYQDIIEVIW